LILVCVPGHWYLIVVHIAAQRFELFDPMLGISGQHQIQMHKALRKWLYALAVGKDHKNATVAASVLSWAMHKPNASEYPQQQNGYDCGVYVVKYMQQLALGRLVQDCTKWTIADEASIRGRMALEFLDEELSLTVL
jgi:Ulp1 family protease